VSSARLAVSFRTLGCKVNRVESDAIASELLGRGCVIADADDADVIVINTCTVTAEADAKARKAVRQALRGRRSPVVVVTGCLAALDADGLRALGTRVVAEADKSRVAAAVSEALGLGSRAPARSGVRTGDGFRTRVSLKIEDGCDNFCTYCIVPFARGVPRAEPLDSLVRDAESLLAAGVREIVLTGINLGRYADGEADLADAITALAATGIQRLRLSSIEPPDLTPRLLQTLAATPAVCAHLHVPLQSGSDEVLAAMGRTYTTADFARYLAAARSALPGLVVTTDVIAGFPAESATDHARTVEFVQACAFAKLHVFRYSQRAGTPAARMTQVPATVRAQRASELRALGDRMRTAYVADRLGRTADVLVERIVDGIAEGTTRDYLRVRLPGAGISAGEVVEVVLSAEMVAPERSLPGAGSV